MTPRSQHRLLALAAAVTTFTFTTTSVTAQINIDDILPVTVGTGNQGTTGLAVVANYDASASDKLVVVYSTEHAFGINAGMTVNSIEYNGIPMIEAVQENTLPGTSVIFYLDNPGPAGEIRIFQGNQNGGRATVYALSNVALGFDSVGQSQLDSVDVTTSAANSLVIAGILDGGQATNGNGAGAPTAIAPLIQDHSALWGNNWAGHCAGHQFVTNPGVVTSSFLTLGPTRLRTVAIAFREAGCVPCANAVPASINNLGGGTNGTIATTSTGNLGCPLNYTLSGATPNALGLFAVGVGIQPVPLSVVLAGCPGTIMPPNPIFVAAPTDASGGAALNIGMPPNQALCGQTVTAQYAELQLGACFIALSDGLGITIGN